MLHWTGLEKPSTATPNGNGREMRNQYVKFVIVCTSYSTIISAEDALTLTSEDYILFCNLDATWYYSRYLDIRAIINAIYEEFDPPDHFWRKDLTFGHVINIYPCDLFSKQRGNASILMDIKLLWKRASFLDKVDKQRSSILYIIYLPLEVHYIIYNYIVIFWPIMSARWDLDIWPNYMEVVIFYMEWCDPMTYRHYLTNKYLAHMAYRNETKLCNFRIIDLASLNAGQQIKLWSKIRGPVDIFFWRIFTHISLISWYFESDIFARNIARNHTENMGMEHQCYRLNFKCESVTTKLP